MIDLHSHRRLEFDAVLFLANYIVTVIGFENIHYIFSLACMRLLTPAMKYGHLKASVVTL